MVASFSTATGSIGFVGLAIAGKGKRLRRVRAIPRFYVLSKITTVTHSVRALYNNIIICCMRSLGASTMSIRMQKVRRRRLRSTWDRVSGTPLFAPVAEQNTGETLSFMLVDCRAPLPFPDPERDTYLRVFTRERRPESSVSPKAVGP